MSRVRELVDRLHLAVVAGGRGDKGDVYQQTSTISMASYRELTELARYLNLSRSKLAGMLLTSAIEDAIDRLDAPEAGEVRYDDESGPVRKFTPGGFIRHAAARASSASSDDDADGEEA